jgi:hypothetical protein
MNTKLIWMNVKLLADKAIQEAYKLLPNVDGTTREDFAITYVQDRVEALDQTLPVIGQYMDLPLVDLGERMLIPQIVRAALRAVVRKQFAALEIQQATAL